jgi:hypothetical protein
MVLSLLISLSCWLHPVHVSVTEINYSEKDKALQLISRIFIDDLELAIQEELNDTYIDILKPANGKTTDEIVSVYLLKHIKIKVDGKTQTLKYLGHEVDGLAMICYIEIPNIKKLKTVEPMNDVIMDTHHDQSNLVHVTYKEKLKSLRLVRDKPSDILTFETK